MAIQLCAACQKINVEVLQSGHKHESSCEEILQQRHGCILCKLLCEALCPDPSLFTRENHLYLRRSSKGLGNTNDSEVSTNGTCDVYMIPSASDQPPSHVEPRGTLRFFASEDCSSTIRKLLPGRPVLSPDCDASTRVCREWLDECLHNHRACRVALSGLRVNDTTSPPKLPTRVIDVGSPTRLVVVQDEVSSYLALSYCWGTTLRSSTPTATFLLTSATLDTFQQALPSNDLPKTVRDAIKITRNLGFKYLWADCLCIIQDSKVDWLNESQHMGRIFQNAACTIAATAAENSTEGLFTRAYTDFETNGSGALNKNVVQLPCRSQGRVEGQMYVARMSGDLPPGTAIHPFHRELERSSWNNRAWVVQERLLSRRILHFGQSQLFFECQTAVLQESSALPVQQSPQERLQSKRAIMERLSQETSLANRVTSYSHELRFLRAAGVVLLDRFKHWSGTLDRNAAMNAQTRFWGRVVKEYNATAITRQSDKLIAILGLATMLGSRLRLTYCAGLWTEDIARSLYWWADIKNNGLLYPLQSCQIPTWSWAAWQGSIRTASFVGDFDNGRPRITAHCDMTQQLQADRSFLKIVAHCWPAVLQSKSPEDFRDRGWTVLWTPPIHTEPLVSFDSSKDVDRCIAVQPPLDSIPDLEGLIQLDDWSNALSDDSPCLCMILHCSPIYRKANQTSDAVERAYGYYFLVLVPSRDVHNAFVRIGIGVCVAPQDCLPSGSFRHLAPTTEYVLV